MAEPPSSSEKELDVRVSTTKDKNKESDDVELVSDVKPGDGTTEATAENEKPSSPVMQPPPLMTDTTKKQKKSFYRWILSIFCGRANRASTSTDVATTTTTTSPSSAPAAVVTVESKKRWFSLLSLLQGNEKFSRFHTAC